MKQKKKKSSTWFWWRHIVLAASLIILAYLLINEDLVPLVPSPAENNQAAKGFSDFYAKVRNSLDLEKDESRQKFVLNIPEPEQSLEEVLSARDTGDVSLPKRWRGRFQSRRFRTGETLKSKLEEFAKEEGVTLLWWLPRDYVIKHPFQIEETVMGTAYKISKAIDSEFEKDLLVYFCPEQRALVMAQQANDMLRNRCQLTTKAY